MKYIWLTALVLLMFVPYTFGAEGIDFTSGNGASFWQNLLDSHSTKSHHALAFIYLPIMVLLFRSFPVLKDQIAKHEDLLDIAEERLKNKDEWTNAEAKIVSAMAWKSCLSYVAVIIGCVMLMISL